MKKGKTSNSSGITLIALVITLIVLLILAGISISMLSGNNSILQKATDVKTLTGVGQEKETIALAYNSALAKKVSNGNSSAITDSELNDELDSNEATASGSPIIVVTFTKSGNSYEIDSNGIIKPSTPKDPNKTLKVAEHKNEKFSTNTELEDNYKNKITVPAGFKIVEGTNVTEGIVIEDVDANGANSSTTGSKFVWIPVGDIYTDSNGSKTNIELCRCGFNASGEKVTVEEGWEYQLTVMQNAGYPAEIIDEFKNYTFTEDSDFRTGSVSENATAKNLNDFKTKASKGYYIGRYEARKDSNGNVTEKEGDSVYDGATQLEASSIARDMYSSTEFTSDLMNSYAWDTAILFLQAFDDRADKSTKYSLQTSLNNELSAIGTTTDKICNIYDMAGNYAEWTTETFSYSDCPYVARGGSFNSSFYTSSRSFGYTDDDSFFRPILYVK